MLQQSVVDPSTVTSPIGLPPSPMGIHELLCEGEGAVVSWAEYTLGVEVRSAMRSHVAGTGTV
jgi:hypothetical protein